LFKKRDAANKVKKHCLRRQERTWIKWVSVACTQAAFSCVCSESTSYLIADLFLCSKTQMTTILLKMARCLRKHCFGSPWLQRLCVQLSLPRTFVRLLPVLLLPPPQHGPEQKSKVVEGMERGNKAEWMASLQAWAKRNKEDVMFHLSSGKRK